MTGGLWLIISICFISRTVRTHVSGQEITYRPQNTGVICKNVPKNVHYRNTCQNNWTHRLLNILGICNKTMQKGDNQNNKSPAKKAESREQNALALVPYDEGLLPVFHKGNRTFQFGKHLVTIKQDWQASGVAAVVWDAAVVLCEYLLGHPDVVKGKNVLELGAGTGLAGIIAAQIGANVVLTDRKHALDNLRANVALNNKPPPEALHTDMVKMKVAVQELNWGENLNVFQEDTYDVILGADIIYIEDTFPLLLKTLEVLSSNSHTSVIISCKIRYERDQRFLDMMKEKFDLKDIFYDKSRDIHIYLASKYEETYT